MKKQILVLAFVASAFAANAQSDFKPAKGDVTTEFGLSGGVLNTNFNLNEGGNLLRFRYFTQEKMALRLGFGLSSNSETENFYGGTNNDQKGTINESNTQFMVNLGVEKHFAGTDRLSPYVGGDVLFGYGSQKTTRENVSGNSFVSGFSSEISGPSTLGIGLRALVGADYYIAKRLYLGAEGGFGFLYSKSGKSKTTSTTSGVTNTFESESAGNEFELNPSVITGVRIGFVF